MKSRFELIDPRTALGIFAVVVFLHACLWVFLADWWCPAYKPDVIELQFISREGVIATAKQPMLPAWLLALGNRLTGEAFWTPFLLSQLCAAFTMLAVFRLGRSFLPATTALTAALVLCLCWFFSVESTNFNQNIVLIPLWTSAVLCVHEAIRAGKTAFWVAAGLAIGFGLHAKYPMLLLAVSLLVFSVVDVRSRRCWLRPGPYLTLLVSLAVFTPHLIWVSEHGFCGTRTALLPNEATIPGRLSIALGFVGNVAGFGIPMLLGLLPLIDWSRRRVWKTRGVWKTMAERTDDERWSERLLACVTLLPLMAFMLFGAGIPTRLNADYAAPLWPCAILWFCSRARMRTDFRSLRLFFLVLLVGEAAFVAAFFFQSVLSPYRFETPRRYHFPMQALGRECERIWAEQESGPCPFVSGEWWIAGNAAQTMHPHPRVHAFGLLGYMTHVYPLSTWSEDEDFNRAGGLVFWDVEHWKNLTGKDLPPHFRECFPTLEILPPLVLPYQTRANIPPAIIGVAIVRPTGSEQSGPPKKQ